MEVGMHERILGSILVIIVLYSAKYSWAFLQAERKMTDAVVTLSRFVKLIKSYSLHGALQLKLYLALSSFTIL